MANWKKMAEAFGRAMSERAKDTPASKAVANSKTVKDIDKIGYMSQANPEQRAYLEGALHGGEDNYYAAKERGGNYEKRIDEIEGENSDATLQRDFDQGFEEALNKRGDKIRSAYTLEGHEDLSNQAADNATNEIRRVAIEMLQSGKDIGDVLRILRGE